MISIQINVIVDADSLEAAYHKVSDGMEKSGLGWESTDEWYRLQDEEVEISPEEINAARDKVLRERDHMERTGSMIDTDEDRTGCLEKMSNTDLDEAVHEVKSIEAALINNEGREAQIEFLVTWGYEYSPEEK